MSSSSSSGTPISVGVLGQDSLVRPFLRRLYQLGNDGSVPNIRLLDSAIHQDVRGLHSFDHITSLPFSNSFDVTKCSSVELFFSPMVALDPTIVDASSISAVAGHLMRLLKLEIKASVDEGIAICNDVDGILAIVDSFDKSTFGDVICYLRRLCSVNKHLPVLIIDLCEEAEGKSDAGGLQDIITKVPFSKGHVGLQFAGAITLSKNEESTSIIKKDTKEDLSHIRSKHNEDAAETILKKLDEDESESACTDTLFARIISLLSFTTANKVLDACLEIILYPRHLLWDNDTEGLYEDIIPQLKRCFEIMNRDSIDDCLHDKELITMMSLLFGVASVDDIWATKKVINGLLAGDGHSYDSTDDLDTMGVSFDGFLVFLHSLVSQRRHRAVWDLLTHYGHHTVTGGACWSVQDFKRADDAFSRTAFDVRAHSGEDWWWAFHKLYDIRSSCSTDHKDNVATPTRNILPMPTFPIQCTLSKTAAFFLKGLYSSESRYKSFDELWTNLPSEISNCPWDGIIGLPTLSHSMELAERRRERHKSNLTSKEKHISDMAESQLVYSENSLESVHRFFECFQLAASLSVSNEKMRHHIIKLIRWWGYKGATDQLFSFRPSREYRHGTKEEDGGDAPLSSSAVVIHVLVCGARQCGKSDMVHFTRFDKDVVAQGRGHEEDAESNSEDDSKDEMLQRTPPNCASVRAVTLSDGKDSGHLTTIFYHEIPAEDQEHIFDLRTIRGDLSSAITSGRPRSKWPMSVRLSFPSLDTIDVCILAFDGSDPYSFSYFTQLFKDASSYGVGMPCHQDTYSLHQRAPSNPPTRLCLFEWICGKRLPIVPVLLKGDENPAEQIINVNLPSDSHALSTVSSGEQSSITSADAFCEYYGLQWPPILTSSADECMWDPDIPNEIEDLNSLVMGLASSPSALIGHRINMKEKEIEKIIEKTAIVVRRTLILATGFIVGSVIIGRIVAAIRGKPKK
eukprot:Tbor_TRINITY_DN5143_c0_g1::TRINITY_DN5143_c0_g1_i1::g.25792::m.25792